MKQVKILILSSLILLFNIVGVLSNPLETASHFADNSNRKSSEINVSKIHLLCEYQVKFNQVKTETSGKVKNQIFEFFLQPHFSQFKLNPFISNATHLSSNHFVQINSNHISPRAPPV